MRKELLDIDTALITTRTVVRRFRENDGEGVYTLIENNISKLHDYHRETIKNVTTPQLGEIYVRKKLANWLLQKGYTFGVWDKKSAELIGFINIFDINWVLPEAHLEFLLDHNFTGRGIMTEALFSIIRFGFNQLKLEKLYFTTLMDDYAGQRLARKCSFRREGDLRGSFRKETGELIDLMLFGLTRSELEKA